MTSTISTETGGAVLARVSLAELLGALFPCGSVTGAPKIRTMEIIRELEEEARGVYTGAVGYLAPNGEAIFNVPIRTLRIAEGQGEMGIGSGIVYDSEPEQEWQECLLKGRFLTEPSPDFSLFETLLWQPGQGYWLLEEHLARLKESAVFFCFSFSAPEVLALLEQVVAEGNGESRRVRLTLYKDGSLQAAIQPCESPRYCSLVECVAGEESRLPRLGLSNVRVDSSSPWYFHKTSRRELYQAEFARAQQEGLFDVCFFNERDELTEGCISNLILCLDGKYFTPPVSSGLLAGTLRRRLLEERQCGLEERVLTREDCRRASAFFCCNSVRGVVRVHLDLPLT